jgi:ABC-type transporter Mla maintaining outer membrane lipid asymmetry ATPase subunit MlaF
VSTPQLAVANVTKRFGAHQALDGVSLDVATGEGAVIVGPSGCGKTTLLRLVAGLDVPDGGEIWMSGTQVSVQHRPSSRTGHWIRVSRSGSLAALDGSGESPFCPRVGEDGASLSRAESA